MNKRQISVLLILLLLFVFAVPAGAAEHPFTDVPDNAWFAENVAYVYRAGWMNGTSETLFSPEDHMTRAMLATVLYRFDGSGERGGSSPFTDLQAGAYYVDAVNWAFEKGIVTGVTEDTFCPDENVTREQIVTMFYRYARYVGRNVEKSSSLTDYPDYNQVSEYAVTPFAWAVAEGIIKGDDGWLDPRENALRSQCAAIMQRFDGGEKPDTDGGNDTPVVDHRYKDLYVLMYHSVAPDGTQCGDWTISQSRFREHMQWLKDKGYTPVLPRELAAGKPLPKKAVVITFDDGYKDNYTNAYPILREFGYKAVIYTIGKEIDHNPGYLTWAMCREMDKSGLVEIGSHTYNHHDYPGIQRKPGETKREYEKRVLVDIEVAYKNLQLNLGKKPTSFAYPHGIMDSWAEDYINGLFPVTMQVNFVAKNDISKGLQGLTRVNINDKTHLSEYLP